MIDAMADESRPARSAAAAFALAAASSSPFRRSASSRPTSIRPAALLGGVGRSALGPRGEPGDAGRGGARLLGEGPGDERLGLLAQASRPRVGLLRLVPRGHERVVTRQLTERRLPCRAIAPGDRGERRPRRVEFGQERRQGGRLASVLEFRFFLVYHRPVGRRARWGCFRLEPVRLADIHLGVDAEHGTEFLQAGEAGGECLCNRHVVVPSRACGVSNTSVAGAGGGPRMRVMRTSGVSS